MATSSTAICNLALRKLREQPIASLTESSEPARLCNEFYEPARDYLLARHPHNFATTRQQLSQLAAAPAFEFDHQYALPTDPYCLRAYKLWHNGRYYDEGWQVESLSGVRVLLTDLDTDCYLLYIARISDVSLFPPTFVEALADYLAVLLAYPLTRDRALTEQREAIFQKSWREHRSADGGEGFQLEPEMGVFTRDR